MNVRDFCPACKGTGLIDSGGVTPWETAISLPCPLCERQSKPHAAKVEYAMLYIAAWMIRSRYRILQHRHDGAWLAKDESAGDEWNAASLVDLVELMTGKEIR